MTEQVATPQPGEYRYAREDIDRFRGFVESVSAISAEVSADKTVLLSTAEELLGTYNVNPRFLHASDNAIGLLLAAGLHTDAIQPGKSYAKSQSDRTIANNFAQTLFGPYSLSHPLEGVRGSASIDTASMLALHVKYKNDDLSKQLQDWLETSDETQDIRTRLGVNCLSGAEAMVLRVAGRIHTRGIGKAAASPPGLRKYVRELYANSRAFMQEKGADPADRLPYAYTVNMYGTEYICISEATARILLEPEIVGYQEPQNAPRNVQALLKHELVHSQGSLILIDDEEEASGYIGELLEEYRAEVFSGFNFKDTYNDVYRAIEVLDEFKGTCIADIIRGFPRGGGRNKAGFYGQLIGTIGLTNTAKLAALQPEPYAQFQSCQSSRNLYDALSGGQMDAEIIATMTDGEIETFIARPVKGITDEAQQQVRAWMLQVRQAAQSES